MAGLLGKKIGMTRIFDEIGNTVPVTVLHVGPCFVTQIKTEAKDGYEAVQLGFDEKKPKNLNKTLLGHLNKAGVQPLRFLKEFKNLKLAEKGEVRVPSPFEVRNNVLVMEFIGDIEGVPAPRMKDIPPDDPEKVFHTIIEYVSRLYHKAKLVHADLSEYNVLMDKNMPVLIDLAQGVLIDHPHSKKFLF